MPEPRGLEILLKAGGSVSGRHYASPGAPAATVILAHGAGAPQTHPFMVAFGRGLAQRGVDVVTFNFLYMEARRRLPDPAPALERCYLDVIEATRTELGERATRLFIGGKSMGGRMASHVAAHHAGQAGPLAGLVFLGYPLHPPGRPAQRRDGHLPSIAVPMLFVQGARDVFGTADELATVVAALRESARLLTVENGDHSLSVPTKGARTSQADVYGRIQDAIVEWMSAVAPA